MLRTAKASTEQEWGSVVADEAGTGLSLARDVLQNLCRGILAQPGLCLASGANTLPSLVRHLLSGVDAAQGPVMKNEIN